MKVFMRDSLEVAFVGKLDGNLYTVDFSKESTFHATCLMAQGQQGVAMASPASPCRHEKSSKIS